MKQLVRLRMRPSRDGNSFAYLPDYKDFKKWDNAIANLTC